MPGVDTFSNVPLHNRQSMQKKETWPVWRSLIGLRPLCLCSHSLIGLNPLCSFSLGLDFISLTCTGTCDAPAPLNSSSLISYLFISLFLFLSLFPITVFYLLPRKTIDTINKGRLKDMINSSRR